MIILPISAPTPDIAGQVAGTPSACAVARLPVFN